MQLSDNSKKTNSDNGGFLNFEQNLGFSRVILKIKIMTEEIKITSYAPLIFFLKKY